MHALTYLLNQSKCSCHLNKKKTLPQQNGAIVIYSRRCPEHRGAGESHPDGSAPSTCTSHSCQADPWWLGGTLSSVVSEGDMAAALGMRPAPGSHGRGHASLTPALSSTKQPSLRGNNHRSLSRCGVSPTCNIFEWDGSETKGQVYHAGESPHWINPVY